MKARNLTFSYSKAEDRLVVVVTHDNDERAAIFLTRRLTARLIQGLATILEKSSAIAARAPAGASHEIILLEHQSALSQAGTPSKRLGKSAETAEGAEAGSEQKMLLRTVLASNVVVNTHQKHFEIILKAGARILATFNVNRAELHRILNALLKLVQAAEWNIETKAGWLEQGETDVVLN